MRRRRALAGAPRIGRGPRNAEPPRHIGVAESGVDPRLVETIRQIGHAFKLPDALQDRNLDPLLHDLGEHRVEFGRRRRGLGDDAELGPLLNRLLGCRLR